MTIADVFAALSILILVGIGIPSLLTLLSLLFPETVEHAKEQVSAKPLRTLGRGVLVVVGFIVLAGFSKNVLAGPGHLLVVLTIFGLLSLAMIGGAGIIRQLSELWCQKTKTPNSVQTMFATTFLVELSILVPLVGWFVVLPAVFLTMLGAGVSAVLHRKHESNVGYQVPTQHVPGVG